MVYIGISMNLVTFRKSNHYIFGDACENGLGAFLEGSGKVYAYVIHKELRGQEHINLFRASLLDLNNVHMHKIFQTFAEKNKLFFIFTDCCLYFSFKLN